MEAPLNDLLRVIMAGLWSTPHAYYAWKVPEDMLKHIESYPHTLYIQTYLEVSLFWSVEYL